MFSCALVSPSSSHASTTIGQLATENPPTANCSVMAFDVLQPTVTAGTTYVVPAGGTLITSWSTNAAAGVGQTLEMKVFRQVAAPVTYRVIGHDGPHTLTPGTVNTFPTNVPVQPGDVLGLQTASSAMTACLSSALDDSDFARSGDLADGASGDFIPNSDFGRVNVTASVAIRPSNTFSFGGVKRHKKTGAATLAVNVPGPGTLALTGKGVKTQRAGGGAVASKTVSAAGTVKLPIKAKGKAKHKLNKTGKVKVKVTVTYTPNGDVVGDPKAQTKRVNLVKKH
jgi:hypothetical protein